MKLEFAKMNFEKSCRLCLFHFDRGLLPIYEIELTGGGRPRPLTTFMNSFLEKPLSDDAKQVYQICVGCLFQIKRFYEFKVKCDKALKGIFAQANREIKKLITVSNSQSMANSEKKNCWNMEATKPLREDPPPNIQGDPPPNIQGLPVIPLSSLRRVVQFFKHSNMRSYSNLYKVVLGEKNKESSHRLLMSNEASVQVISANPGELDQASKQCPGTPYYMMERSDTDIRPCMRPYKDHDYADSFPKVTFFKTLKHHMTANIYAADIFGAVDYRFSWPDRLQEKDAHVVESPNQIETNQPEQLDLSKETPGAPKLHSNPKEIFECPVRDCGAKCEAITRMIDHIAAHHVVDNHCQICNCKELRLIKAHCKLHIPNNSFCKICGKGFTSSLYVEIHQKKSLPTMKCDVCGKIFCRKRDYNSHMTTHEAEKQGTIKLKMCCTQVFYCRKKYLDHRLRYHYNTEKTKRYTCTFCPANFTRRKDLESHKTKEHPNSKKEYKCLECSKIYSHLSQLNFHMRTHMEKSEAKTEDLTRRRCDVCFEVTASFKAMQRHRKTHFKEEIKCPQCDKVFNSKSVYSQHKYSHTDRRRFRCELCNMSFKFRGNLNMHTNTKRHKQKQAERALGLGKTEPV